MGILNRVLALVATFGLLSCTADKNPTTFQGEALFLGADPNSIVRTIDDPNYPAVMLTDENGVVGIGIFQPETGSPVLTVRDDNNDGVFDLLTYSSLSESGEVLVEVDDYGMDGQPDLILNYQNSTASMHLDGEWHTVDGVGSRNATILINDKRISLKDALNTIRQQRYD